MREALRRLNVEEAGLKAYAALAKSEERGPSIGRLASGSSRSGQPWEYRLWRSFWICCGTATVILKRLRDWGRSTTCLVRLFALSRTAGQSRSSRLSFAASVSCDGRCAGSSVGAARRCKLWGGGRVDAVMVCFRRPRQVLPELVPFSNGTKVQLRSPDTRGTLKVQHLRSIRFVQRLPVRRCFPTRQNRK